MEIYKDIPNYEGLYQVSDLGNVKSFVWKNKGNRILKAGIRKNGYKYVVLHKSGKAKTMTIHQLVAIAFLNHKPCGYKLVINHKDFNPSNNCVSNLEIVTNRENSNKKHIKSSSDYVGVCRDITHNKWKACITFNGKLEHLGNYKKEYDAHLAYQKRLIEINNIK